MRQTFRQRIAKKSIYLLIALSGMVISGCVSINTGQSGVKQQSTPPQQNEVKTKESKVSMEEAASFNMTLGAQYLKQNKIGQAITKLEKAVEQQPNLALAHTYLGFAYEQYGEVAKAKDHYGRAIKLDPEDPIALNNYGTFLCRQNELRASLVFFEKAAENRRYQTPDAAYANAGVCARKIPDLDASDKYFRRALTFNPKYADAHYHLADIGIERDDLLSAQQYFTSYQKLVPEGKETPELLWLGYRLNKAMGKPEVAGQFSLQLQKKFPTSEQTKKLLDRS